MLELFLCVDHSNGWATIHSAECVHARSHGGRGDTNKRRNGSARSQPRRPRPRPLAQPMIVSLFTAVRSASQTSTRTQPHKENPARSESGRGDSRRLRASNKPEAVTMLRQYRSPRQRGEPSTGVRRVLQFDGPDMHLDRAISHKLRQQLSRQSSPTICPPMSPLILIEAVCQAGMIWPNFE
jgi:hypothetical protein